MSLEVAPQQKVGESIDLNYVQIFLTEPSGSPINLTARLNQLGKDRVALKKLVNDCREELLGCNRVIENLKDEVENLNNQLENPELSSPTKKAKKIALKKLVKEHKIIISKNQSIIDELDRAENNSSIALCRLNIAMDDEVNRIRGGVKWKTKEAKESINDKFPPMVRI